jgi:hypothetical protein
MPLVAERVNHVPSGWPLPALRALLVLQAHGWLPAVLREFLEDCRYLRDAQR